MKYIFYADVYFITNFIMDSLLLGFAAKICRKQISATSLILGAFIGAILTVLDIIYPIKNDAVNKIYAYFVISFMMCIVTFGVHKGKELLKIWICMFFTAFVIGGVLNATYYYMGMQSVTVLCFVGFTCFSYMIMSMLLQQIRTWRGKTGQTDDIIKVLLIHKGIQISVPALYDSGNSLTEPFGGKPVHIIEQDVAMKLIKGGNITNEKIKIVPYHSLGEKAGLITVFECEKLCLYIQGEIVDTGCAYLGIYQGKLTERDRYKIILNRSINKWL